MMPAARARAGRGPLSWLSVGLYLSLVLVLVVPLVMAFLWSLVDPRVGWFAPDLYPRSLALDHWRRAANDRGLAEAILTSLFISGVVTAISALLALPTAFALAKVPFRAKRFVEMFILAPLIVPGLIVGVGVGVLFLRMGLAYTILGVILVQTIGTLPYMIRVLASVIEAIPADLIHAARTLGASPLAVGWHIVAPLAWPGFIAGGLLTFISSFEEFEKSFIVGSPVVQTLTIKLWTTLGGQVIIFPNAAVLTFILLVPVTIIFLLAERAMRNERALAAGIGKL